MSSHIPKAIGVIIENDLQELLLLKRSLEVDHEQGKWENCGGKVEINESFEEAAIREVKEEIGCNISELRQITEYLPEQTGKYHIRLFIGKILGTPKIMEENMFDDMKWVKKSDLKHVDLATYALADFKFLGWIE